MACEQKVMRDRGRPALPATRQRSQGGGDSQHPVTGACMTTDTRLGAAATSSSDPPGTDR